MGIHAGIYMAAAILVCAGFNGRKRSKAATGTSRLERQNRLS